MKGYAGLCLGGPYDGQLRASESPRIVVVEQPELDLKSTLSRIHWVTSTMAMTFNTTEYRYERLSGRDKEFVLWVYDSMSIDEAIERLIDGYVSRG